MIKWSWPSHSLDIVPDLSKTKRKFAIHFGAQGGNDKTEKECVGNLVEAVKAWGGPHGMKQWTAVESTNILIWDAAVQVWGKPKWIEFKEA